MKKRDINYIDIKTGSVTQSFTGDAVTAIKYSPDYKYLITSSNNG